MKTLGLGLVLMLAGVAPASAETNYERAARIAPTITQATAKKVILLHRERLFKEPGSVRNAKISDPFTCLNGSGNCICIEANARNSYGGYTGIELLGIRIQGDQTEALGKMYEEARQTPCGRLVPFPELNGRAAR
jgi:hypothetical protein